MSVTSSVSVSMHRNCHETVESLLVSLINTTEQDSEQSSGLEKAQKP